MKRARTEQLANDQLLSGIAITPNIGLGNPTETLAAAQTLRDQGVTIFTSLPRGFWVAIGSKYHISMTANTDKTMQYAQGSGSERTSWKTTLLLRELNGEVRKAIEDFPTAAFVLTPQNMMGETAHSSSKVQIPVIMVLPDAMGKLHPRNKPTKAQQSMAYLVWNEAAQAHMQQKLRIENVQLIPMLDPLTGYGKQPQSELKRSHPEVFEQGNLCFIKLSGSGGDSKLINAAITALWKNSDTRSIVFPGQKSTQKRLVKKIARKTTVRSSLDEALFYNLSRNMIPGEQMYLTYPSEQFKHMMLLSQASMRPKVVWLPPRGEHEVVNLAEYMLLASQQGLLTTILLPKKHHATLHKQLANFGYSQNMHYELITPEQLSKERFHTVPAWKETAQRTPIAQAILNILSD